MREGNSRMTNNRFVFSIIMGLIIGGAVTIVVLYSTVETDSAFIASIAIVLAAIFLLGAYVVNTRQTGN
jgi:VIT1/CCC1 family predicted Fe2+/Mn2+ transporter